ncbi:E7, partial [Gammapapillomavirus 25]
LLQHGRPH